MRRGTSREKTTKLIQDIRAMVPNIAIRTTMIAGYPGETEEDFQEMYNWVEEMKFDRLKNFSLIRMKKIPTLIILRMMFHQN